MIDTAVHIDPDGEFGVTVTWKNGRPVEHLSDLFIIDSNLRLNQFQFCTTEERERLEFAGHLCLQANRRYITADEFFVAAAILGYDTHEFNS